MSFFNNKQGVDDKALSNQIGNLQGINVSIESYPIQVPETDDAGRINRALTDLNTKGGGVLNFTTKTYLISAPIVIPSNKITLQGLNNAGTIIKASVAMDKMVTCSSQLRVSIRDIQFNGDLKANVGLYTSNVGMLFMDNVVTQRCLDKGWFLDNGTYMFDINNCYVLNNTNYGIYIGNDCAGSKMNVVIAEQNGINLRIGYTRMLKFDTCTFQRYTTTGNVLIQAGWDVTFDTCWFEPTSDITLTGETYDFNLQPQLTDGANTYIGHSIRILNCSFHGVWGSTGAKSKHCILDSYTDTVLENNYIDGTSGGYTGGKWYENSNSATKVVGLNNQINGGQGYTLPTYALWQTNVGNSYDGNGYSDDQQVMFSRLRIAQRMSLIAQSADLTYDYDGRLYHSGTSKRMKFATDGKYWDLLQAQYVSFPPSSGTYKIGDICINNSPTTNGVWGWTCVSASPLTWKPIGVLQDKSAFKAYQNAIQSIPAATFTKLYLDTKAYDDNSEFDTSSFRFTAKQDGTYLVSTVARLSNTVDQNRIILAIYKNGTEFARVYDAPIGGTIAATMQGSTSLRLSTNDYIEFYVYTANATSTVAGQTYTFATMAKLF